MNLEKFKRPELSEEVLYWIDHNLKNYLKKNDENHTEIDHIIDYLSSNEAPKRLRKMSYNEANRKATEWTNLMIKKAAEVCETEEDVEVELSFENGFRLVKLVGENAFKREGFLMSHCVGSYFGKSSKVYSLRDGNNKPHCTVEVTGDKHVQQIKGKGNGSIHPKYVDMIIKTLEHFGMSVGDHDLPNLGYVKLSADLWKVIDTEFEGVKYITFNNTRYVYKYSRLVKKGA